MRTTEDKKMKDKRRIRGGHRVVQRGQRTKTGQEEDTGLASTARGQQQDKWTHYILHLSQPPESLGGLAELVLFLEPL